MQAIPRLAVVAWLCCFGFLHAHAEQPPHEFWLQLLDSEVPSVRLAGVVQIIQWAGSELTPDERMQGTRLLSKLATLTNDANRDVRLASVRALGRMGIDGVTIVPCFRKAMESPDLEMRQTTTDALLRYLMENARLTQQSVGNLRPRLMSLFMQDAALFAPLIAMGLRDVDASVRWSAMSGLENALQRTLTLFPSHTRNPTMVFSNKETRQKLFLWVQSWSELSRDLIPRVKHGKEAERLLAARTLEILIDWTMDFDREYQAAGLQGHEKQEWMAHLRAIQEQLPDLVDGLPSDPIRIQLGVLAVLEAFNQYSHGVRGQVQPFLKSQQRFVRWSALRVVSKWGAPRQGDEWQRVVQLLEDADQDVRQAASKTLLAWVADQEAATVGPAFVMKGEAMHGNMEASMLLIIHPLMRIVSNAEPEQQEAALATLGWLGRDAYPALHVCLRAMQTADPRIRRLVPDVLMKIAPRDQETGKALEAALLDPDDQVKTAAAQALLRWRDRQR